MMNMSQKRGKLDLKKNSNQIKIVYNSALITSSSEIR